MDEIFETYLLLKKQEFFSYIYGDLTSLWKSRDYIDSLQKEIHRLCSSGDVTSRYFEELEERYHILNLLHGAHEELLILDMFNRPFLLSTLKRYRQEVRRKEERIHQEIKNYLDIMRKYPPENVLTAFYLKDILKMVRALVVCRYKYNHIRSFLNRHYKIHPEVAMALVFNPPMGL